MTLGLLLWISSNAIAQNALRIVAFGNSITAERKTVEKVFAQRLPDLLLQRNIQVTLINSGVGGSHTGRSIDNKSTARLKHAQDRFQTQVLDHHPDLVIIGFGANDAYIDSKKEGDPSRIPLEKFSNNMRFMIETLQARGIRVILMATNGYRPGNQDFQHRRLLDYIHEAEKLANTYNTGFVNNQRTFEQYEKSSGRSAADLFEDHLHPNDAGHQLIAESLALEIENSIQKRKPKATHALITKDQYGAPVTIPKPKNWKSYRKQIQAKMEAVMGTLPRQDYGRPQFTISDSLSTENYKRLTISIEVAPSERVSAYLYIPNDLAPNDKRPALLALHETDMAGKKSVDGEGSYEKSRLQLGYGKELAERGYVILAPDYPSFGDSADHDFKADSYESGTMKGIFNHRRCIDLLESLVFVNKNKIGVIGHSLGGHNAIFLAAFDDRIKVTVSSCGWTQLDYYDIGPVASERYGGRLGPFAQERYMPLWKNWGLDGSQKPFDFHELISAIAPRAFFSSSPTQDGNFDVNGVKEGIWLASLGYKFLGSESNLRVVHPEVGHEFPAEIRNEAYLFIDQILLK